jgi:polyhydroxyalkanoate synthesis repressor PhaR
MSQPGQTEANGKAADQPQVVVKKYANRRLYNTESSSYITLDTLAEMVRQGRDFAVFDAKTGDDITRSVLTQIIVEEESKGRAMLPTNFLRQLIGFYGDQVQNLVPKYLEQAMSSFSRQQEQMRVAMQQTMGNFFPFGNMEEVGRQNLAMMERAMSLFTPFLRDQESGAAHGSAPGIEDQVNTLRAEVEFLRSQLARVRAGQEGEAKPEPAAPAPAPRPAKPAAVQS